MVSNCDPGRPIPVSRHGHHVRLGFFGHIFPPSLSLSLPSFFPDYKAYFHMPFESFVELFCSAVSQEHTSNEQHKTESSSINQAEAHAGIFCRT